jgi:hypothetical protein
VNPKQKGMGRKRFKFIRWDIIFLWN